MSSSRWPIVLALVVLLAVGLLAGTLAVAVWYVSHLPVPIVEVSASYPGANRQVVAEVVAIPIEQQVQGVERLEGQTAFCTDDGGYRLTLTFRRGTDPGMALDRVRRRVALAEPMLPVIVQLEGNLTVQLADPPLN